MGNPAYEARREAERAEAELDKALADAARASLEGLTAFMNGDAELVIAPYSSGSLVGWAVRLIKDSKKA